MFKAIFTNSAGILFSRILGFIRDLLTASFLGANLYSDIFFIAFKLPNLFRRIFAEGAFAQSFIPAFTRSLHKGVFAVYIALLFSGIIMILTLFVNLFPSLAAKMIAFGYDKEAVSLAAPFVAINFWYLPLIFGVTFLSALLQYRHHFATTAFGTGLLNIALIVALLLSRGKAPEMIVYCMSWGVVAGGALQLGAHIIMIKKLGVCKLLVGGLKHLASKRMRIRKETKKFQKEFFPAIWGNSTAQLSAFLDTWLASFLSAGAISYLYYANRVFQLPLALFAIATSVAIFPKISRYLKNDDPQKAHAYLEKALWILLLLLIPSMIGGIMLAHEITFILFERGSFDHNDTQNTAWVLQMYMIGLLPFGLNKLFSLWLYASQKQLDAAKIATYSLGSNIALSLALIYPLGAVGLALASSISGFVAFFLTLERFGFKKLAPFFPLKKTVFLLLYTLFVFIMIIAFKSFVGKFIV